MSRQPPSPKKSNMGLWLGGAAILLVALIAILVLLLNRQPAPAAPASAVIVSAATATSEPAATPTTVDTVTPVPTETPTSTPIPELGTSNVFIEYILDASGSMTETLSDGSPKIEVAKQVLTDHMRSFRPETNIGLRAYGHRLPYRQEAESCKDIELVASVEKGQMERIVGFLQDFKAQGMTPLAASLQQAKEDFTFDAPRVNSIVMLSDGIETCGGDPCKLVEDLKAQGINFTIHVIGLNVDDPTRKQLSCIAQAGDGTYHDARSQQDLGAALSVVKADVIRDEVIVPPGVDTPTPVPATDALPSIPGEMFTNPQDGAVYVHVPAGEFLMGSTDDDPDANDDEKPQHTVYLDEFWIMKTEVTIAQYRKCMESGSCPSPPDYDYCTVPDLAAADIAVDCIGWSGARSYCDWAGARLPTEAEWEKAARGTDGRRYPWGNQQPDCALAVYGGPTCRLSGIAQVGSRSADISPYGGLDMAGNASEWVTDLYTPIFYSRSPERNPSGPAISEADGLYAIDGIYVKRGGTWNTINTERLRVAARSWAEGPIERLGFRCTRSP